MSSVIAVTMLRVGIVQTDATETTDFNQALSTLCSDVEVILNWVSDHPLDPEQVDVVVWFQYHSQDVAEDLRNALGVYLGGNGTVIPVVPDAPAAKALPDQLSHFNAFCQDRFGSAWPIALADWVFSETLLRRRRRVFISYRRDDSQAIVHQLYDALTEQRWEVFLDNRSIDWGEDFQRELHWELHDSDFVLLLASPRFQNSQWVMEEIGSAVLEGIGVLAVNWPDVYYGPEGFYGGESGLSRSRLIDHVGPDRQLDLGVDDLVGPGAEPSKQVLTEKALEKLWHHLYAERVPAQHDRLLNYDIHTRRALRRSYQAQSFTRLPLAGDYTCTLNIEGEVQRTFVRIFSFRPGPAELHALHQSAPDGYSVVVCVYPEIDLHHPFALGLHWLMHTSRQCGDQNRIYRLWRVSGSTLR